MKKAMIAVLALSITLAVSTAQVRPVVQETISGRAFRAIQAAMPALERFRFKTDVTDYTITVITTTPLGPELAVLFHNPKDASPKRAHKGCAGPKPCIAVRLRSDDLQILGANLEK